MGKSILVSQALVNTDRYGALAKDLTRLQKIAINLLNAYKKLQNEDDDPDTKRKILDNLLNQTLLEGLNENSTKYFSYFDLIFELEKYLKEPVDYLVFATSINGILLPTNIAVKRVPTVEATDFARKYARALLDVKKEKALPTIIRE